jgi:uncharacterized protein (DUF488 family)
MKLYTVGYTGWDCETLLAELKALGEGVKVCDVRYRPFSRQQEFSRKSLSEKLGDIYVHASGLGNVDYKSDSIRLADPEPWYGKIERHLAKGKPVVLLCACVRLEVCHRLVIARELERRLGIKAEHLKAPQRKTRKNGDSHTLSLF